MENINISFTYCISFLVTKSGFRTYILPVIRLGEGAASRRHAQSQDMAYM